MKIEILPDAEHVARRAAALIAEQGRTASRIRGKFLWATSGGTSPWRIFELLANQDVQWSLTHVFQVDERVTEASNPARNITRLHASLLDKVDIPADQIHAMPVEDADLVAATQRYATTLRAIAGTPPVLDLVQLGLGADGHTASLIPGDPVLDSVSDVAVVDAYQGFRRMTLTFPVLERARQILWVVTGSEKASAVSRLRRGDPSIPAARLPTQHAVLLIDVAASGG